MNNPPPTQRRPRRHRTRFAAALALAASVSLPFASAALPVEALEPPPGSIENVEFLGNLPSTAQATAINFLTYGQGSKAYDVLYIVGRFGLQSFDISDPESPVFLDQITSDELKLPGDASGTFWQNEDMDVDPDRKLVFLSRDPRAYNGSTNDVAAVSGVYIVDASDPTDLQMRLFHEIPTGHTTTCINDCDYLWTGGPASNPEQAAEWPFGRPIFATDIRDLDNVVTSPEPIDTGRRDGSTGYAHDVQVDAQGIAWVSGSGGVRGYHTDGVHRDPLTDEVRLATAFDPIPYGGGGIDEADAPSAFMHNSDRPVGNDSIPGSAKYGFQPGQLIMSTEEAFGSSTCDGVGQFVISSLVGSFDGESWSSTPDEPFRLETVATWSPAGEAGTNPAGPFCSAHYFDRDRDIIAYSWYGQGTRFLDVSNPTDPIQIAYFRPEGGVSWAPYFYEDVVYVADHTLGLTILRLDDGASKAKREHRPVDAPRMTGAELLASLEVAREFGIDPASPLCVIPTD